LAIGVISIGIAAATCVPKARSGRSGRSVRPLSPSATAAAPAFDREHAAGLFVGVRTFDNDELPEVPYAVDDAIDLAYMFALDSRVRLVVPRRVILALSGQPQKAVSRRRLHELQRAGAQVRPAHHDDIVTLLEQQAALAGNSGLLIVSLATHGVVEGGVPQVVGASCRKLSTARLLDVIAEHEVPRSLIFVDACRERIGGGRGVKADPYAVTPLMKRMPGIRGQVMLSAVDVAYDDPVSCNGVFTKAVIDGLGCEAIFPRGQVTAETLAAYVERTVRAWIRKNRNPHVGSAIQTFIDGAATNMPLSQCWPLTLPQVIVSAEESTVSVFNDQKRLLWTRDVGSRITSTAQADGTIVAGTQDSIIAFDRQGARRWSAGDKRGLRGCVTGDLFRKHNDKIVALWGSRLSIYDADGKIRSSYDHDHAFDHVAICQPTSHHAPRIVVTSGHHVLLFDPKKMGKPVWSARLSEPIVSVRIIDYDHDTKNDIALSTAGGATLFLDCRGRVVGQRGRVGFERASRMGRAKIEE